MARRPTATSAATKDEPLAWEAREYLRKMLVGKSIFGTVHHKVPTGREYGSIIVGSDPESGESVTVKLLGEGYAKVRDNCKDAALIAAQDAAKAACKGIWAEGASTKIRDITWEMENPRALVDKYQGKPVSAIIENVRDGSTVRAFLLPDFYHITLMMSGVRVSCFPFSSISIFSPA